MTSNPTMNNNNFNLAPRPKDGERSLIIPLAIIIATTILLAIAGFLFMKPEAEIIEGQAEATSIRISGKLPGRIIHFYVTEGDFVNKGDTLVHIHSSLAEAKLFQAEALENAAMAQNEIVDAGTRKQVVQSAFDMWQQAIAAAEIAKKTFDRMQSLYSQNVVSQQKRDEAQAAYKAATAAENAVKSQYDLALEGARSQEKASALAMVNVAHGGVMEIEALLQDQYLTAPCDGQIDIIYPNEGELIALGAPIMNVLKVNDKWITFNVREENLNHFAMGDEIKIMIPALNRQETSAKVYFIRDLGAYAVWHATKASGQWDSRTFQVKARPTTDIPNLRPGMTIVFTGDK